MKSSIGQIQAWLELSRIARVEIILDAIENILAGLDIPRNDEMWLMWEQVSEQNAKAVHDWEEARDRSWHYTIFGDILGIVTGRIAEDLSSPTQTSDGDSLGATGGKMSGTPDR